MRTMATQTGIAIGPIGCISLLTAFRVAHSNESMPKWRNWQTR